MTSLVAIGRLVTGWKVGLRSLVVKVQAALFLSALLLPLTAWSGLDEPRTFGGLAVFPSDLIVVAALGSALALRYLSGHDERPRMLRTPLLSWPLLAFALLLIPGIVRGHERYGESLVSQPLRLVFYAGLAAALTELTARQAFRWITVGLYAGAVWQSILATYHIATGTSQTTISALSTGGTRVLSLTSGMFLGIALVIAIVNIDLAPTTRRRLVHALFGGIAAIGMVLAYGRTTFLALAIVLVFLAWALPQMRSFVLRAWRWWVPALAALVVAVLVFAPSTATQVVDRVTANPLTDSSVRWRLGGIHAVLAGMKNGQWDTRGGLLTADDSGNHLVNSSFELGTTGWRVQGGTIWTTQKFDPVFGTSSMGLWTTGVSKDEGWYSTPIVAKAGQTWVHSIWLKGKKGGERVDVSIWEYNDLEQAIYRAQSPVVLTQEPQQYAVKTTITDPAVTHIRVLVRTTVAQKMTLFGDLASLRQVTAPAARETQDITTYITDGAVLSPTIGTAGPQYGDSLSSYAASGPNRLAGGSFEKGGIPGGVQGGTIVRVNGLSRSLGLQGAQLTTAGKAGSEGFYSNPVAVKPGERWSYSVWLEDEAGADVRVGLWAYKGEQLDSRVGYFNLPVTLSDRPVQYIVTGVVPPGARYVRGVVRTRVEPQKTTVVMDGMQVRRQPPSQTSIYAPSDPGASYQIDEPLLGLGFGRETQYVWDGSYYLVKGDPDNSYVFLLAGGGILALGGFLLLLGSFVRDAFRRLRHAVGIERGLLIWSLAAWFIIAVNCAMAPFLPRPKIVLSLWAVMLTAALVRKAHGERSQ
jgi:hypothetical protein